MSDKVYATGVDVFACVDVLTLSIERLIDKGLRVEAILWSLNSLYCRVLSGLEGRPVAISEQMQTYTRLGEDAREDAMASSIKLSATVADLEQCGFSQVVLAQALIEVLAEINDGLPVPDEDKEHYHASLVQALCSASKTAVN